MITPMKKVLLAGRLADREQVLLALREAGVLHVEPVHPELVNVPPDLLNRIARVGKAYEALEKLTPPPGTAPAAGTPVQLSDEVHLRIDQFAKVEAEKTFIEREMVRVAPWGRIDRADLQALRDAGLLVEFVICPDGEEETIEAEIRHLVTKKEGLSHIVAVCRKPLSLGPRATRIPEPLRDVFELESDLAALVEEEGRIKTSLHQLALRRDEIRTYHAELEELRRFSEVELSLMKTGPVFVLQGWVPEAEAQNLRESFEQSPLRVGIQFVDPTEEEMPPTKLQNPWWCRPIECLYKVLGITPGYREVDISPLFLPFLAIFTAMLFADAGYGLVGLVALVLAYKPLTGGKGVPKELLDLFIVLFSGVVVYGIMTNTYFGTTFLKLTPFNAMSVTGEALLKKLCFLLGAFHISTAHLWKIRRKSFALDSLSEVGWILFAWAMYGLICVLVLGDPQPGWMLPLFGVSVALILFFTSPSWNIFLAVAKGLGAIALSAAGFLSDIISYIRLWAVGLASGILAASFNELATPLPLLLAAAVLVGAHLLNIGLCLVAVFAHGVRLNLLEFSNHMGMEWSGREYQPFRKG
jgi:V/A-type H+-transporting ATPase subunit I